MICKSCGNEIPEGQKYCGYCGAEQTESTSIWYFVEDGESRGPYTENQMKTMIQNGTLNEDSYIWRDGMADWTEVKNTVLKKYLPQRRYTNPTSQSTTGLQPKSIVACLVLTFVTCGLYGLYWTWCEVKDTNELLARKGLPTFPDPLLVIVFTVCTCGIYAVYFNYMASKQLAQAYPNITDNSNIIGILYIISLFLALFSAGTSIPFMDLIVPSLIQQEINQAIQ